MLSPRTQALYCWEAKDHPESPVFTREIPVFSSQEIEAYVPQKTQPSSSLVCWCPYDTPSYWSEAVSARCCLKCGMPWSCPWFEPNSFFC